MLFNSLTFIAFILIVFSLYWLPFTKNKQHQNFILLLASYIFYGWWDYRFLSLIIFSSLLDFYLGNKIHQVKSTRQKKRYLYISLFVNLGLLFVFKYFNFFTASFLTAFNIEHSEQFFKLILPVGISFYTFQTLSYSIDIYRNELKPSSNIINFLTFVSFFPQLVAGPIERAKNFLPQIQKNRSFSYPNAILGCRYILYGLFKKVVIADNLAEIANIIFEIESPYSGIMNLIGITIFAIQIYCDFSGYSDIAIGVAKLFNINLMTNFKQPYFSTSLAEFWSRWHISLSTWFKDYVYIPLGGNKGSKFNTMRNLFLTFLISGFWHGANWTFLIWGAIHGIFLVFEKILLKKLKIMPFFGFIITISIVFTSWVFFRAENLTHALDYLSNIFDYKNNLTSQYQLLIESNSQITIGHFAIIISLTIIFILAEILQVKQYFIKQFNQKKLLRLSVYLIITHMIFLFGSFRNSSEFIYFQF